MGLPFHSREEPPRAFAISSFWVFHLSPSTPSGQDNCSQPFLFLLQAFLLLFLQLPSNLNSHFLCLNYCLFHDIQIFFVESPQSHRRTAAPHLVLEVSLQIYRWVTQNQSVHEAILDLFARYWKMQPLFLAAAQPMKVEWKISPYFGVLALVFKAVEFWCRESLRHHDQYISYLICIIYIVYYAYCNIYYL